MGAGSAGSAHWQVIAWACVRYGHLWIYSGSLNLNIAKPTIHWEIIAKSWFQQWPTREGKRLAQQVAKLHLLGLLTWYLGDGEKHPEVLRFVIQNDEKYVPKQLAQQILQAAYSKASKQKHTLGTTQKRVSITTSYS